MDEEHSAAQTDRLNEIGVITRREIEARLLAPLIADLSQAFGREPVLEVLRRTIIEIARQQGADLALSAGGCSLLHYAASLEAWKKGDAMKMDLLCQDEGEFSFTVTRCRYAEMYHRLGIPELGAILSCSRDAALIEGFNPEIKLTRTQTIMDGSDKCDFRYKK